jgi:tRNA 2-thiouridine synthesizing protein D
MRLAVLVNEGPYQHQASDSAYQFTQAALAKGHQIYRVFFYHDGVYNARVSFPPQDERSVSARWSGLAKAHALDLVVCIVSAQRRGIVDAGEMRLDSEGASGLAEGFRVSGLGQLIEAAIRADRLIVFGD